MKNTIIGLIASTTILFNSSCTGGSQNLSKGKVIDPLQNELIKLETDKSNNSKRFSVLGYPAFNADIKAGYNDDPVINIYSEPNGQGRLLNSFPIHIGKNANEIYVPKEFSNQDIVVYDNEGKSHKYDEKMQFSFSMDMQLNRPRNKNYLLNKNGLPQMDSLIMVYPTYFNNILIDEVK
ncbi:hypothetical protein [Arachidicoccus soli]|nr:hypothetical protein [Arachidicoccus soli]